MDDTGIAYQKVEDAVVSLVENLRQFSIIIEDFQEEGQDPFQSKIHQIVDNMINLEGIKDSYSVEVPIGVLNCIDEGKNPDIYTKQSLEECYESQQTTDGKSQSLQNYKRDLEEQISENFPESDAEMAAIQQSVAQFVQDEIQAEQERLKLQHA